jgi:hypothetical protein
MALHPTDIRRQPLTQEANVVVPPCAHAVLRRVQVLIPGGDPKVLVAEGKHPNEIGPNRVYKMAPFPPGTTIKFALGPDQWLIAATTMGTTAITLIVEYEPLPQGYSSQRLLPPPPEPPTKVDPTRELVPEPVLDALHRMPGR